MDLRIFKNNLKTFDLYIIFPKSQIMNHLNTVF